MLNTSSFKRLLFNKKSIAIIILTVVLLALFLSLRTFSPLIIVSIALGACGCWVYIQRNEIKELKKTNQTVFFQKIQKMASIASIKCEEVIKLEERDKNFWGLNIHSYEVPFELTVGVDLSKLTENDIHINTTKKQIILYLPNADFIQEPAVKLNGIINHSKIGFFRKKLSNDEVFKLIGSKYIEEVKSKAQSSDVFDKAEKHVEHILRDIVYKSNYKSYELKVMYKVI